MVIPHLSAHGIIVNNQCGQPVIRSGPFRNGIHSDRKSLQPLEVPLIHGLLLCDVLLQMKILTANHTGYHIAHAIIIADLLVLIPCRILARLRGPFAGTVRILQAVGQKTASGAPRDNLVPVIGNCRIVTEAPALPATDARAHCLRCILNQKCTVSFADGLDLVHASGKAVELCGYDEPDLRI